MQYPPCQGTCLGMNFHTTPHHAIVASSFTQFSIKFLSCSVADKYVKALSNIITCDKYLWVENLQKARRKVSTDRSVTVSRWTILVVTHVNRHIGLCLGVVLSDVQCPVKSIPFTVKDGVSCSLTLLLAPCLVLYMASLSVSCRLYSGKTIPVRIAFLLVSNKHVSPLSMYYWPQHEIA